MSGMFGTRSNMSVNRESQRNAFPRSTGGGGRRGKRTKSRSICSLLMSLYRALLLARAIRTAALHAKAVLQQGPDTKA